MDGFFPKIFGVNLVGYSGFCSLCTPKFSVSELSFNIFDGSSGGAQGGMQLVMWTPEHSSLDAQVKDWNLGRTGSGNKPSSLSSSYPRRQEPVLRGW